VFVSQRGLQEVYTSTSRDATTSWEPAPPSPELEAEELQKLLVKLGGVTAPVAPVAPVAVAAPAAAPASAPDPAAAAAAAPSVGRLIKGAGGHTTAIELDQVFERAWRQVGLALDRGGFTIEDRDRIKGLYFVRYIDPEYEATVKANQGWWARLTSSDPKLTAQQFRIALAVDADHTRVMVQTQDGTGDAGATGERILNQINEQLR
jgi:outer membrane protein assembly factor BamC